MSSPPSALNAPLTPRSRGHHHSPTPGRRAAISEAFEAVKLDDEIALYQAMNKSSSSSSIVDCNAVEPRNPKNTSLLHWATYLGSQGCFEMLLSFTDKINVNIEESDGKTPLHYAAFQGNMEMITALEHAGANLVKSDQLGQTPCHLARINGKEEAAKLFPNYQEVLAQGIAREVHSDVNFVPGNDGTDVLESFASPQSSRGSPHLMMFGHHRRDGGGSTRSASNQQQQQPSLVSPNVFANIRSPQLHPRYHEQEVQQQQRRSASSSSQQQQQRQDAKGESFAQMIASPFTTDKNDVENHERKQQQQQEDDDPALRENSEELRQLAADEANLEAMEREIELEETAQRVAQAQVAWLDGIKSIAKQQNTFGSDNQLSERLWELCSSVESQYFLGPANHHDNSGGETNDERNEIERKASLQLRTVTMNVEKQLLEKRAKNRQYPVVSFRWTPDAFKHLMNKADLSQHHHHHHHHHQSMMMNNNNNTTNTSILSPMSSNSGVAATPITTTNRQNHHQNHQPFRSVRVVASSNSRATSQISSIGEPEARIPQTTSSTQQKVNMMSKATWQKPPPPLRR